VAGMLRSLDYAARTAAGDTETTASLGEARAAFVDAYGGPADDALLAAFELEKACYEVRYEANNRPDWLWLPLAAVARLVER
jgi:predicted trehalose synthase